MPHFPARLASLFLATVLIGANLRADPVPVRYIQGSEHGFVVVKTLAGTRIATGDMTQVVHGDRVIARLTLRFRDGSIDVFIDALTGQITSHTKDGKTTRDRLDLPLDVSNGLPPNLLMNILPTVPETKLAFVAPTEKPRLIHVSIKPVGEVPFMVGGTKRKAIDYVLHAELGGITGVVAPLIGKQPGDYHIWILAGVAPAFIREEGALYAGGPVWRIEQISPAFPTS